MKLFLQFFLNNLQVYIFNLSVVRHNFKDFALKL